jgi:hypothetical protein
MPGRFTEHNLEIGCGGIGHQVRLPGGGAERGLDIERGSFRICRQNLCDNGGDGADGSARRRYWRESGMMRG